MLNGLGPFRQIKAARPPGSEGGLGFAGVACPTRSACLFRSELIKRLTISIKVFNTSVLLHLSVFFFLCPLLFFALLVRAENFFTLVSGFRFLLVFGSTLTGERKRERERAVE